MRVMVIVKATKDSEAGILASPKAFEDMAKFNEELVKAGVVLLGGDGLKPSSTGKRVRFSGSRRTVIDGPFTETKELIAGYGLWQVRSMEEAVEWVKRSPNCHPDDYEVEIRPLFESEDFASHVTDETKERVQGLRSQIGRQDA
jgi:hypothetical protein